MLTLSLALASLPATFQSGDLLEVLVHHLDTLDVAGVPHLVTSVVPGHVQADGSWIATASLLPPGASALVRAIIGQDSPNFAGPVEVHRVQSVIGGLTQNWIGGTSRVAGQVGYTANVGTGSFGGNTAWIDDLVIAMRGDAIPGTNSTWSEFHRVHLTMNGTALIEGIALDPGPPAIFRDTVVEWPTNRVVVMEGAPIAGTSERIRRIVSGPSFSNDGLHWVAAATTMSGLETLIVDGQIHDFGGGQLAASNEILPPRVAAFVGPLVGAQTWEGFENPLVNSRGDVAFVARFGPQVGTTPRIAVRNGTPILVPPQQSYVILEGIDERGAVISTEGVTGRLYAEDEPIFVQTPAVDGDRDGVADPGWALSTNGLDWSFAGTGPQRLTLVSKILVSGPPVSGSALLRGRDYRIDRPFCDGATNSTGFPAEAIVTGDGRAAQNEVVFQAFGLPQQSVGYFLVSRTAGFASQPGGSQGDLCLGGSIGRLSQQIFTSGFTGKGRVAVDLTALPQPSGTVAANPGETWFAQAWYRDAVQGVPTSNFPSAVATSLD